MSVVVVPTFIRPTRSSLEARVHELAAVGSIDFEHPHFQERLAQRHLTMRQVLEALKHGEAVTDPKIDQHGDWRLKMRRYVAGRRVLVVVAIKFDHLVVVTAM